ncbi:MAG: flagellin [Vibrionaceae bacterium]|nr:flagellin [Vibrionaceae bacterium]
MVMSTVEVRSYDLRVPGRDNTSITSSRSTDATGASTSRNVTSRTALPFSYSVSSVMLTQGQQHATSVQIATKALQAVGKELTMVKRGLTQALNHGTEKQPALQNELARSKNNIHSVLEQTRFDGNRVVDNELNLTLNQADVRRFSIPGLNVHRQSERAEQIRLDFPQGQSVMVQFDGRSDGKQTVKMLDRSLIPLGLRASLSNDGTILFESSEKAYQQMQQKVMVTGQGYRFPAGQANLLNLKSEPDGINELTFDLGSRDGIKNTIVKVNQHLKQVQKSLETAREISADLSSQMQSIRNQSNMLSPNEVNEKLALLDALSSSGPFTSAFKALNAQANVKRHTVVALMRG